MSKYLAVVWAVVICGLVAPALGAVGDYSTFTPNRDWSNKAWRPYANSGQFAGHRAYKWEWNEGILADWDLEVDNILQWMTDNPVGAGQRYKFEWLLCTCGGWTNWNEWDDVQGIWIQHPFVGPVRLEVRTLNMTVDWAEGDGQSDTPTGGDNFNWSPGVPGAVDSYAQCLWYMDMQTYVPTVDFDNCIPWTGWDGTVVDTFQNSSAELLRELNSKHIIVDPTDPGFADFGTWTSVELDYDPADLDGSGTAVVNDLLYSQDNRGLILGRIQRWDQDPGTEEWGWTTGDFDQNVCFYAKDWTNSTQTPYLKVSIALELPIPGDTNDDGWVDGADYTNWADNYQSSPVPAWADGGWTVGNFNADDTVDGADYTVWADNYNPPPPGGAVPEPATLVLLALGAAAAVRRRR